MSQKVVIDRMRVTGIVGSAVTLAKDTSGQSEAHPPTYDASTIIINTTAATPPAEMWKLSASGYRYRVTIEVST